MAYSGKKVFLKEDRFVTSNETIHNTFGQFFSNVDEFLRVFEGLCHFSQNLTFFDIVLKLFSLSIFDTSNELHIHSLLYTNEVVSLSDSSRRRMFSFRYRSSLVA